MGRNQPVVTIQALFRQQAAIVLRQVGCGQKRTLTAIFDNGGKCMHRYVFITSCLLCLGGCYTVNNERFAADMHELVAPGLDMASAMKRLEANRFTCDAVSAAPATTCTRTRQSVLPYTCIERVILMPISEKPGVGRVDVPKIMCTGL